MVLYKRKGVNYLPRPSIDDDAGDIWVIPETSEVFTTYEAYLQRMDWYKLKRFTCEVSGRSGLSYFDALRSENAGSREVEQAFPDPLKSPVLRRVQFSTTSRIDNLVDEVFDDFKSDFYPGEVVTVVLDDGQRLNGKVRDKAKFAAALNPDGTVKRKAFSRYFVRLIDRPDEEALVDDEHIVRDRKIFTKQMLRSFIKNCVSREAWNGAPWLVKQNIAEQMHIPIDVPHHLRQEYKAAERKAQRKAERQEGQRPQQWTPDQLAAMQPGSFEAYQQAPYPTNGWHAVPMPQHFFPPPHGYQQMPMQPPNGYFGPLQIAPKYDPPPPPPPAPIKYPIDDMDVEPQRDGTHRPTMKFAVHTQCPEVDEESPGLIPGIDEPTVGLLLETWNTLNVYCQVVNLDMFTFDDFVDAMQFSSDEVDCELLVEMHCAVLKKLVNPENEQNGAIQISLPDLPDPEDDEDEDEEDEEESKEPTPEPEYPAKRTRSSLNKVQFADQQDISMTGSEEQEVKLHRAAEMFGEYGWIQRLRKRDFRNGGWELVMVGLLHQVAGRPRLTDLCNKILIHLAPLDADATIETVRLQYSTMGLDLRISALQTICQLFLETKSVKNFLEEMSMNMTQLRKVKIEHQRTRKDAMAKLKSLQIDRRLLAPTPERTPTPIPELEGAENVDPDKTEDGEDSIADSDDGEPLTTRSLRRGQDRAAERKRKREEEAEKAAKKKEDKKEKGSKEYQKCLRDIEKERDRVDEAEEQILIVDNDLREADSYRTRVLGKDRFCNRYWWFERNAMPHAGLSDSSTADAGYVNGRLWVQGPDDMEREGYIDVTEPFVQDYVQRFQLTPTERKKMEEGPTQLHTANQWGFYDSPDDIDMLIGWLDVRGLRELKLKKELTLFRDTIAKCMENRKAYLAPREQSEEPSTRMSTRTKTYISESDHRCLRWENTTAVQEEGHKHSEEPLPKKGRARKIVPEPDLIMPTVTRGKGARGSTAGADVPLNRQGKRITRQGQRYEY